MYLAIQSEGNSDTAMFVFFLCYDCGAVNTCQFVVLLTPAN